MRRTARCSGHNNGYCMVASVCFSVRFRLLHDINQLNICSWQAKYNERENANFSFFWFRTNHKHTHTRSRRASEFAIVFSRFYRSVPSRWHRLQFNVHQFPLKASESTHTANGKIRATNAEARWRPFGPGPISKRIFYREAGTQLLR